MTIHSATKVINNQIRYMVKDANIGRFSFLIVPMEVNPRAEESYCNDLSTRIAGVASEKASSATNYAFPPACCYSGFAIMGLFRFLFFPWGLVLQGLALFHFVRRRPDGYWLWIILLLGPLGACAYLLIEAAPDLVMVRNGFKAFPRRQRISELKFIVHQNPAPGNYEELADLYFDDKKYAAARECYNHAITARSDTLDPFYRRGLCEFEMKDYAAAIPDLEFVVGREFGYDFQRAAGLLAACYGHAGQSEKAAALFQRVLQVSSSTEVQYNYAEFLSAQSRNRDASELLEQILAKKAMMNRFQRRLERSWLRRAEALRKRLASAAA